MVCRHPGERGPFARPDLPMNDVTKAASGLFHHAIAGHMTARIYAQYPERAIPFAIVSSFRSPSNDRPSS